MADYTARSSVILNGQQAEDQLEKLGKRAKDLRDEMKKLREANDLAGFKEKERELKEVNKEMGQMRKEVFSVEAVLKNLSGASFKEISTAARKANNEFKAMKQTDPGYAAKAAQVKLLNGKMRELSTLTRSQQSLWERAAGGFNKFFGIITAGAASFAGVFLGMRKAIDLFNNFQERVANLSALTGQTGDNLNWLAQQAKDLSNSIQEGGIRITQSADNIVDAFTKMGSARPELLKNKEALVEVTKKALILAEAAKMETEPAIAAVAAAMNQFDLAADQSTRIINAFAAGSLAGSAEVNDLTESFANVGTVADDSNITLEQTVGILEVLAEKQLKGAEAGTMLRSSLLKMKAAQIGYQSGTFNLRDALVEANEKLKTFSTDLEKDAYKQEIFGERSIVVGTILLNNIGRYDEMTAAVTGTNTAIEQAIVNTDTQNAKLAQAKNRISVISMELGQKLTPAYTSVISKSSLMLKGLVAIVDIFSKYGGIIVTTTATIAAYTIATKLATMWQKRSNTATLSAIISQKLQALAFNAQFAAIALYNTAIALMTGKLKVAAIQFRYFSAALAANPVGLVVGAVVALGAGLYMLSKRLTDTEKLQRTLNNVNLEAEKQIVEERLQVEQLLKVARNELRSKEDRLAAVKKLNEISPDYLGSLTLETINTDDATKATNTYITALREKAKIQAAQEKLVDIEKELIDLQTGKLSFWDKATARLFTYNNGINVLYNGESSKAKLIADSQKALLLQKEKLLEITEKQINLNNNSPKTDPPIGSRKTVGNEVFEWDGKKWNKVGEITGGDFETMKKSLETAFAKEQNLLKQQLLEKKLTKEEFNRNQYVLELAHLVTMRELYKQHGEDFITIEGQIIDKKLAWQQHLEQMLETSKTVTEKLLDDDRKMFADIDADMDKYMDDYKKKLDKETEATIDAEDKKREAREKGTKQQQQQAEQIQQIGDTISNYVNSALTGTIDEYQTFGDTLILMSIDILRRMVPIWSAQILGYSLSSAESVASWGIAGVAKWVALTTIMNGALSLVEGSVKSKINSKKETVNNKAYASGKYPGLHTGMYGDKPQYALFNEVPGQPEMVIDGLTTRKININYPAIRDAIYAVRDGRAPQFADGKYPSSSTVPLVKGDERSGGGNYTDPTAIIKKLDELNKTIANLKIYTAIEDIRKGDKKYSEIQNTRGL